MRKAMDEGYTLLKNEKGDYYSLTPYQDTHQFNPLIMRDRAFSESKGYNVNGVVFLNLKPAKGFVLTSRLGYRLSGTNNYVFNHDYYATPTMFQNFASIEAGASNPVYYQWENFVNYANTFGEHNITGMLGTSFIESRDFGVNGSITGGDGDLGIKKNDPLYAYFAYATPSSIKNINGGEEIVSRKLSYFGRLSYDYANKYVGQFSLRADATDTSVLPVDTRWGYFPAASMGWIISNEDFMENTQDVVSHLKIRASWGQNGTTANLGGYSYASTIGSGSSYPYTNEIVYTIASSPTASGNNKLKWETSEQTDLGLDARFLADRLTISFDYYDKKTKDLIISGFTPSMITGVTASPINAGNVSNKGVELELGWRDNYKDFNYSIRGNLATLKNKVTYLHESLKRINGASMHTSGSVSVFEKGFPAWYFRGYQVEGIDVATGDPIFKDFNDDGVINDSDKTMIGNAIPDLTYGLTLTAGWKGLDLTVFGTGVYGNQIFNAANRGDRLKANLITEYCDDRWTPTHTVASRPRAGTAGIVQYWLSDAVVFDGSYFKIKQIQLGYAVPKSLLSKISVNSLHLYCSLDDFFVFTSYPGFDPEIAGSGNAMGVDKGYYPSSKKVVFGLNVAF
jgi:TonB-linked SusC/RagA family outer membrane protein